MGEEVSGEEAANVQTKVGCVTRFLLVTKVTIGRRLSLYYSGFSKRHYYTRHLMIGCLVL